MSETYLQTALGLTETVLAKSNEIIEVSESCEQQKGEITVLEAELMREIANAMDDKGKPVFSNETSRNAELAVRRSTHTGLIEARTTLNRENVKKLRLQNELEKYRTQVSLYKAFLNGGAA